MVDEINVEITVQYNDTYNENIYSLLITFQLVKVEFMKMDLKWL